MDWLTESALLNMPGPSFLGFYAVFAALVIAAINIVARWDGSEGPPLRVPARPDPYEIAFLRAGVGAVIVLAIYALKRADLVEMHPGGHFSRISGLDRPGQPIEESVLDTIGAGASAREILRSRTLRAAVEGKCEAYRRQLTRQGLVATSADRFRIYALTVLAVLALGGLAALKMVVAQMHGHHNVGFLLGEALFAVVALIWSVRQVTRSAANARGRAYLSQVKTAYSGGVSAASAPRFDPVATGAALTAFGALGFAALRGTPDEAFAREFTKNTGGDASSGGCGGGDGGGGGGGCGGCGGGGD